MLLFVGCPFVLVNEVQTCFGSIGSLIKELCSFAWKCRLLGTCTWWTWEISLLHSVAPSFCFLLLSPPVSVPPPTPFQHLSVPVALPLPLVPGILMTMNNESHSALVRLTRIIWYYQRPDVKVGRKRVGLT